MKIQFGKSSENKWIIIILFVILQFLIIVPEIVGFTSVYKIIRYIQHVLSVIAILLFLVIYLKNKFFSLCLAFFFLYALSTFVAGGEFSNVIYNFERSFTLLIYYKLVYDYDQCVFYKWSSNYWMFILILNTALTLAKPDGILSIQSRTTSMDVVYYFLGVSNQIIPFYLIGITITMIYETLYSKKKLRSVVLMICMWLSEAIYQSATAFLGCVIFTVGYFLFIRDKVELKVKKRSNKKKKFYIVLICSMIFVGYYMVVIGRVQNYFAFFIEKVLHRNVTFSTRTIIWDHALQMIRDSWLLGYGAVANNNRYIFVGRFSFNAHNIILQILLMGGVILGVIFGAMIRKAIYDIVRCNNIKIRYSVLILFVAVFFMSLTEVYSLYLIFIVLGICNIGKFS